MVYRREFKLRSLSLAADARLSRTDYTDDHAWELLPGEGTSPALALQTRYGGRVGLASLVPMWVFDGGSRTVYQAQTYSRPPQLTGFAPGYARAEAELIAGLALTAEYWVMESQAVGARYTLTNNGQQAVTLRLDVFGHVVAKGEELKLAIVTLAEGGNALSFGSIGRLSPVVLMDGGRSVLVPGRRASPKIGVDITLAAGETTRLRWVHAGTTDLRDSLALAKSWLGEDWELHFSRIAQAAAAIPIVEVGEPDIDAAIAVSYQYLMQAFLRPTNSLPHASFVANRTSTHGYSPAGDGTDHDRDWSGQHPQLAYLVAAAAATIDASLAQGIVLNYLAVQDADGAVDYKPGLAGQRAGFTALPLLARMAYTVFQYTEDDAFIREILPKLLRFYAHWFSLDTDADTLPEWQNERQTGYLYFPTFGTGSVWAQNGDIHLAEGPGMASYLLSEGGSLRELARRLQDTAAEEQVIKRVAALQTVLDDLWREGRYAYRDGATHNSHPAVAVLEDARADEEHFPVQMLTPPARLVVRVTGGMSRAPRFTLRIDGTGADDQPITEMLTDFPWYRTYGAVTTKQVFKEVKRIQAVGLSRVYRLDVQTFDTSRADIHALLPLWSMNITTPRSAELVTQLTDTAGFWRPNGVSMVPASDPNFDPSNQNGAGGVWLFWQTLIGEGLWDYGHIQQAYQMLRRILTVQAAVLRDEGHFSEFYHSEETRGLGESGQLAGIAPLHLLTRVLAVRIVSASRVWTGGSFVWDRPVTVRQHGVVVTRSAEGTTITFPSGHIERLGPDAGWQAVVDPQPGASQPGDPLLPPPFPGVVQPGSGRVVIQIDHDSAEKPQS